jgi:chromosome segregation ATPase
MSDGENVENHTIRLLQEMRGEFRTEMSDMRTEMREMRAEQSQFRQETERRFDGVDRRFDTLEQRVGSLDQRVGTLEPAVLKVIDAVTAIAKTQDQHTALLMTHSEKLTEIQRAQNVMEKDMRGIRGRVERIEDHIGLVKA